jgi:IS5 family transposase
LRTLIQSPAGKEGWKERYKIERKFGKAKAGHGLGRYRYLGLAGLGIQVCFTAIVLNLKQIVKPAKGIGLKTNSALMV